jgi:hypothetical protein
MDVVVEIAETGPGQGHVAALYERLRADRELAAVDFALRPAVGRRGPAGAVAEVLVVALGAGGVGVAFVKALASWLAGLRSDVRLEVTDGERTVKIEVTDARKPEEIIDRFRGLGWLPPGDDGE